MKTLPKTIHTIHIPILRTTLTSKLIQNNILTREKKSFTKFYFKCL